MTAENIICVLNTWVLLSGHWEKVILCHECVRKMILSHSTALHLFTAEMEYNLCHQFWLPSNWKPSYALVTIATWYMKDITVLQRYLQSYSHYLVMPLGSFQPESSKKLLRSSNRKMHHVLRQPLKQRLSLRGKRKLVGSSQKFSWKQQSHTRWNYKDDWFGYFLVPCDFFGLWCVFSYNFLPYFLFISVTLKLSFWLGCPFFHSYFSLYVSILIMVLISSHI